MEADASSSRAQTESPSRLSVASSVSSSPSSVTSSLSQRSQLDSDVSIESTHYSPSANTLAIVSTPFVPPMSSAHERLYFEYLQNLPQTLHGGYPAGSILVEPADDLENLVINPIQTPTRIRLTALHREDLTPRAGRYQGSSGLATPRFPSQTNKEASIPQEVDESFIQGYTLSHLRRVPELVLLARRVVDAEAKRRAREECRKQKEAEVNKGEKKVASTSSTQAVHLPEKSVRGLPLPPIPAPPFALASRPPTSTIWKMGSSLSTAGDSTVLSSALQVENEDDRNISDTPLDEEAYVPLTPSYFAGVVERAIQEIHITRRGEQMARERVTVPLARTRLRLRGA
ncbi:hypothetical protein NM688_g8468 [Phlebia brevispora]|uniref:Uncharacterized protein n=1 Tax=Phlebia brevispora TaxID=194682 RepID=A0ACC1RRQ7_9APHY|nr:hypothetical protein NM688_g8468 [Phlebia brevispora]